MLGRVTEHLYVGDADGICKCAQINYIICVADKIPTTTIELVRRTLSDIELMQSEFQQVITKLNTMCEMIHSAISRGKVVGVICNTGRNVSALIVGHYMIKHANYQASTIISLLESIYHTAEQKNATRAGLELQQRHDLSERELVMVQQILSTRCLTNKSFRRLLFLSSETKI